MKRPKAPAWTTGDGRVIPITDLGDKHLVNILHVIEESLSLFKPASETPIRDGTAKVTAQTLYEAFLNGGRLPGGGQITKMDVTDGSREYTIRYEDESMFMGRYVRSDSVVTENSGRASLVKKKNLSDDRLLMYGLLVIEAVRRGLFTWVQDRKYLSAIALKIVDKVGA